MVGKVGKYFYFVKSFSWGRWGNSMSELVNPLENSSKCFKKNMGVGGGGGAKIRFSWIS